LEVGPIRVPLEEVDVALRAGKERYARFYRREKRIQEQIVEYKSRHERLSERLNQLTTYANYHYVSTDSDIVQKIREKRSRLEDISKILAELEKEKKKFQTPVPVPTGLIEHFSAPLQRLEDYLNFSAHVPEADRANLLENINGIHSFFMNKVWESEVNKDLFARIAAHRAVFPASSTISASASSSSSTISASASASSSTNFESSSLITEESMSVLKENRTTKRAYNKRKEERAVSKATRHKLSREIPKLPPQYIAQCQEIVHVELDTSGEKLDSYDDVEESLVKRVNDILVEYQNSKKNGILMRKRSREEGEDV